MAEIVTVDGLEYKKRSPLAIWGLAFLTLGIYAFVWYFKINKEARNYLGDESIRPGIALLAVTLGIVTIVAPYISVYRTGTRLERMEEKAGVQNTISPALGLLASFIYFAHMIYMQEHLNRVWKQAAVPAPPAP